MTSNDRRTFVPCLLFFFRVHFMNQGIKLTRACFLYL